ncbi:MAG: DEAD/DEAH box helicase family protein, partial [Phycisphaerae bacterium]
LQTGFADYLLYADGKAIGVVEAKPENHTLMGVETQSAKYTSGLPGNFPAWRLPLPFAYESTGILTRFTNNLDPQPCSREVFSFHRPAELIRLAELNSQLRAGLQHLPPLDHGRLWRVQVDAIENLEKSLASNHPRALIQMATGSGKTFTACNLVYRLIKFAQAKRVLFLVDRNNLGRQTLAEFQQFASPGTPYKFTEEFNVQRLKNNAIDPSCKVCITTIQRLYSILKGEPEFDESAEEISQFEWGNALASGPLPVVYNATIPIETFDFIIIDECHRSIYNLWRQVLEYFDAFLTFARKPLRIRQIVRGQLHLLCYWSQFRRLSISHFENIWPPTACICEGRSCRYYNSTRCLPKLAVELSGSRHGRCLGIGLNAARIWAGDLRPTGNGGPRPQCLFTADESAAIWGVVFAVHGLIFFGGVGYWCVSGGGGLGMRRCVLGCSRVLDRWGEFFYNTGTAHRDGYL